MPHAAGVRVVGDRAKHCVLERPRALVTAARLADLGSPAQVRTILNLPYMPARAACSICDAETSRYLPVFRLQLSTRCARSREHCARPCGRSSAQSCVGTPASFYDASARCRAASSCWSSPRTPRGVVMGRARKTDTETDRARDFARSRRVDGGRERGRDRTNRGQRTSREHPSIARINPGIEADTRAHSAPRHANRDSGSERVQFGGEAQCST